LHFAGIYMIFLWYMYTSLWCLRVFTRVTLSILAKFWQSLLEIGKVPAKLHP